MVGRNDHLRNLFFIGEEFQIPAKISGRLVGQFIHQFTVGKAVRIRQVQVKCAIDAALQKKDVIMEAYGVTQ